MEIEKVLRAWGYGDSKDRVQGPHKNNAGKALMRRASKKRARRANSMRDAYESVGMVRVRGALGGVYYE